MEPAEVKEQVKRYLSSKEAGKWLLIFDNANNIDMWLSDDGAGPALKDFLPQSEQGRILFTTQNQKLAVELTSSNIIPIPDVDKDTAFKIFERSLVDKGLLQDHLTAVAVLEKLAFLPLAITQASAYINKNGLTLSTYSALLQEQEPEVVELLSEDFKDEGRYKAIQNPVVTTWLISFKQIQRQDQLAADFLSFMACINPRNIPQSLIPAATSRKRRIDALGLLNAYAFINSQDTGINLHRLVHIAARNWLKKNALFSHWIQRAADQMRKVFPDDDYKNRELWRAYLPHALSLVYEDEFSTQWEEYMDLIENIADCLYSDGRYHEAEMLYTNLIRIKRGKYGPEDPSTLTSMADLALTYSMQGWSEEAEKLQVQVMEISKTVLGAEHPHTLTSMGNLAIFYTGQGRHDEAEKLEVDVLELEKATLGAEHPSTLTSMANLASTYQMQGRWDEAEKLQVQVLEIRKTVLGAGHPDTVISMSNLASTYRYQARWDEAEKLGVQVLEIRKRVLGAEHPNTITSMANLASTYQKQGRWDEAEKLQVQVLEIRTTVLGAEHPTTLGSMDNLAHTLKSQGKLQEALALTERCSELFDKAFGSNQPRAISSSPALSDWKDVLDSLPNKRPPTEGSETEGSQDPETATGNTTAALIVQPPCEERIKSPHTQRWSAAKSFLGDHPLLMAFRRISAGREGHDLQEID